MFVASAPVGSLFCGFQSRRPHTANAPGKDPNYEDYYSDKLPGN